MILSRPFHNDQTLLQYASAAHRQPGASGAVPWRFLSNNSGSVLLQFALVVIGTQELPQNVTPADQIIKLLRSQVSLADKALQTLGLLLSVVLVGANLLEDLEIVLGVLILQCSSEGSSLFDTVSIGGLELGHNSIESLDGAASGIETTADSTVGAGMLVEELNESIFRASALVWAGLGRALLEELDGGVRGDALLLCKGLGVLGFGIDLSNQDVGLVDEGVGESFPGGGKRLAVWVALAIVLQEWQGRHTSAPRRGESNENILVLSDFLLEALVVQEGDGAG